MTLIHEILDVNWLQMEVLEGYVSVKQHPTEPLRIFNYTPKTQFENYWNKVTMACRGLIVHDDGTVIARGMPKFFNLGQPGAPMFEADDIVHVADKADGSLGILYREPNSGRYAIATRGSFVSEQAVHATENFNPDFDVDKVEPFNNSLVFEIIFPANRIVVDYGDRDELVMLGYVDNPTGRFMPTRMNAGYLGTMTFAQAIALPDRENAEGLVLTRISDGAMVKLKQEDYLRLHRAIFGLSSRRIWEMMVSGEDIDEFIAALPDEFQQWAKDKAMELELQVDVKIQWACDRFMDTVDALDDVHGEGEWEKKDFALRVKDEEDAGLMFALYDGKDLLPAVWKQIKPEAGDTPVRYHGEDVA